MEKTTLYYQESPDIKISIQIYFNEKKQLYLDGYDIGSAVKERLGDSDYEYIHTIEPEEVKKIYPIFNVPMDDQAGLLAAIKKEFSVPNAYTLFGEFMKTHDIKYSSFTWI
ncbi:MAG: hypothetical protein SFV55_22700 [Haliscomenobacter sp.]|uniref:hypothetical protein n=1 Tax=Haliscomenobacter sp. TaxID=2717303 RepID=UPI0029B36BCE|nr:hypothetical protein [Haliscomenobacter sp.]MDX2071257.1 hypothetical protein [Haliscomenobacter sp.]